jgi:hypothetical protein
MKYAKTVLLGAIIAGALTFHPAAASELKTVSEQPQTRPQTRPQTQTQTQIAEFPAGAIRNITAVRHPGGQAKTGKAHPPGAQALMALGIALIVTPAMFRGAFSN